MMHKVPICMVGGALTALWACAYAFHLFPLERDFSWWQFPWALTVTLAIGGSIIGLSIYVAYLWTRYDE